MSGATTLRNSKEYLPRSFKFGPLASAITTTAGPMLFEVGLGVNYMRYCEQQAFFGHYVPYSCRRSTLPSILSSFEARRLENIPYRWVATFGGTWREAYLELIYNKHQRPELPFSKVGSMLLKDCYPSFWLPKPMSGI